MADKFPTYPLNGEADPHILAATHLHELNERQNNTNNPNGGSGRKKKHKGGNNDPAGKIKVNVPVPPGETVWGHDSNAAIRKTMSVSAQAQSDSSQDKVDQICGSELVTGGGLKRKKKSKKNKRKSKRKGKTKRKTKRKRKSKRKSKRKIKRK